MRNLRSKTVSEYGQEIPQSQTVDLSIAPRVRAMQQPRGTGRTIYAKQPAHSSQSG